MKTKVTDYSEALNSVGFETPFVDVESGSIILDSGDIIEFTPDEKGGVVSTEDRETTIEFSGVSNLIEILSGGRIVYTTGGETDEF